MCAIFGVLDIKTDVNALRQQALQLSKLLRHRGPDWSGIWNNHRAILVHERLAIVDIENGAQPLINDKKNHILAINGEIYNHQSLTQTLPSIYDFKTKSDCEVILPLYLEHGVNFINKLQGMFAFILYDEEQNRYLIARDHIGMVPLYYGYDEQNQLYVASEFKALVPSCKSIKEFPAGHYFDSNQGHFTAYYSASLPEEMDKSPNKPPTDRLKNALEISVKSHLMSDVPYGVLLSGDMASSLMCLMTKQFAKKRIEDNDKSEAWWPRLHSFAIGTESSAHLVAAKNIADAIGILHHNVHFSVQEGLDSLRDVIYYVESYDVNSIRAAIPMYLLARKIKAMGIKMVLSSEGANKVLAANASGYAIKNNKALHEANSLNSSPFHFAWHSNLHCALANKAMSAWGIEIRLPFLDKNFMKQASSIKPQENRQKTNEITHSLLEQLFAEQLSGNILSEITSVSADVDNRFIESLTALAEKEVSDQQMATASFRFADNTPQTKEAYCYRVIFEEHFPHSDAILLGLP